MAVKYILSEKTLRTYNNYIKQKAIILQKVNKNYISQEMNNISKLNKDIGLSEDEIANLAMSKLQNTNYQKAYSTLFNDLRKSTQDISNIFSSQGFSNLFKIQSNLVNNSIYTVNSKGLASLEQASVEGMKKKGRLRNLIGDTGEVVAELQGTAIANTLIEQFIKNSGYKIQSSEIIATQMGTKNITGLGRSLADTGFEIKINFINNNNMLDQAIFSFSLSDKLSIAKPGKKTIVYRRGTVQSLSEENKHQIYNLMAWHVNRNTGELLNYYFDRDNNALLNYFGQKLLNNYLLVQQKQQINFQVFNGQIISAKESLNQIISNPSIEDLVSIDNFSKTNSLELPIFVEQSQEEYIRTRAVILRRTI